MNIREGPVEPSKRQFKQFVTLKCVILSVVSSLVHERTNGVEGPLHLFVL